jgi:hypothetical protein
VLQAKSWSKGLKTFPDVQARGTSNCSAARPTTTTPSSSMTAPCRCCSPMIDSGKLAVPRADGHGQGRHAALGRRGGPGAHGQPAVANYGDKQVHACCRPMTGCRSASCPRSRASAMARATKMPIVTGQDAKCRRSSRSWRASSIRPIFKDTRELAKVTVKMVDACCRARARDQRHQDLQQRRQGGSVLPAGSRSRSISRTTGRSWSAAATTRPTS